MDLSRYEERLVPIDQVILDEAYQLRKSQEDVKHNSGKFLALCESIRVQGIKQAPLARLGRNIDGSINENEIILVDGRQRYAAAKYNKFTHFPVRIDREIKDAKDIIVAQITCNIHRIAQSPKEVADHMLRVVEMNPLISEQALADMFQKSKQWVAETLRLNKISPNVQTALDEGHINITEAKMLSQLKSAAKQDEWLKKLLEAGSNNAEVLLDLKDYVKESRKGGGEDIDFTTTPRPMSSAKIRQLWDEIKNQPNHPEFAGIQRVVQLDPLTIQTRKEDRELQKLIREVAAEERQIKKAEEAKAKLAAKTAELDAARARLRAESGENLNEQ